MWTFIEVDHANCKLCKGKYVVTRTGGLVVQLHTFLTFALDRAESSGSRPGRFTPGEIAPGTNWIRRLGGPQSRSGRSGEKKTCPYWESNLGRPDRSLLTILTQLLYGVRYVLYVKVTSLKFNRSEP